MPSGGNKRVTATLDIQAQITNYQESLNRLQGALGKLHLPDGLRKGFENLFIDYQRELDKLSKSSANNKLSILNEKEIEKSFDRIDGLYGNLIKKLRSSGYEDSILESDFKAIEQMKAAQEEYSKAVKGSAAELEKEQKALDKIKVKLEEQKKQQKSLGSQKGGAATSQKYAQKAVEDTNKALQAQKEVVQSLTSQHKAQEKVINSAANAQKNALNAQANAERKLAAFREVNKGKTDDKSRERELNLIKEEEAATARVQKANEDLAAAKAQNLTIEQNLQKESAKQSALEAKANEAKTRNTEATRKLTSVTNSYNKKVEEVRQTEEQLGQQNKTVQEKQQAYESLVRDTLTKVVEGLKAVAEAAGIDVSQIKSIEDVNKALEDLGDEAKDRAAPAVEDVKQEFKEAGEQSADAKQKFLEASDGLHQLTDRQKEVERLSQSVLRFFSIDNAVRLFKRAVRSAYETIKDLDAVMTETAVVTDFSVGDMWSQLPEYTKRANELGVSIHSVYEASTLYYQQGLKTNEVMAVTNATLRMARIAGLDAAEATDRVTNALRGFNMEINEANADRIADVYSKLAAISASNVDEISTAMTKVASLANSANMEFENTAAFLAQIIETTRESAETAGTALKTVIARFSEVKKLYSEGQLLGTDEEGEAIDVNKVSTALRTAGIDLNEFLTGAKGLDEVFVELASKWDSLDIVQQRYIATMAAGSRQQSRFIALMSDYQRTQELTAAAQNANGASMEQYEKTLDSLQSKLERLTNAWNEFTTGIVDSDFIKGSVDALTNLLGILNKITDSSDGTVKSIKRIGVAIGGLALGRSIFNKLLGSIGATFLDAGKKASSGFGQGFLDGIDKIKNGFSIFTKDFWIGMGGEANKNFEIVQNSLNNLATAEANLNAVRQQSGVTVETLKAAEDALAGAQLQNDAVLKSLSISQKAYDAVRQSGLSIQEQAILLNGSEASQRALNLIETKGLADAETKEAIAKALANKEGKKGIITRAAEILQLAATKLGIDLTTTATYKHVMAKKMENAALKENIALMAASLSLIGAIIVALALLVVGIVALVKATHQLTLEEKIDKAKESLDGLKESTQEQKEKVDELKSSLDKLTEDYKVIDGLTEGTEAWRDKIKETNQEVRDLISTFSEYGKYVEFDPTTGLLEFDIEQAKSNGILAEKERRAAAATIAEVQKEKELSELNYEKFINDVAATDKDARFKYNETVTKTLSKDLQGNPVATTSYIQQRDIISPDMLRKLGEAWANNEFRNEDEFKKYFRENYSENFIIPTFEKILPSLQSIANLYEELQGKIESSSNIIASELVGVAKLDYENKNGELDDEESKIFNLVASSAKDYYREFTDYNDSAFRSYIESQYSGATFKDDGIYSGETKVLSKDAALSQYSGYISNREASGIIGERYEIVSGIKDKELRQQVANLLGGVIDESITGLTREDFHNKLDNNNIPIVLQQILTTAFLDMQSRIEKSRKDLQTKLTDIGAILPEDATVEELQSYWDKVKDFNAIQIKQLNKIIEDLPEDKQMDFLEDFSNLNFLDPNALSNFAKTWGTDVTQQLVEATGAAKEFDLSSIKTAYQEALGLTKDFGTKDTFTTDDRVNAIKYGAKESDFQETSTGEFRYVGENQAEWAAAIKAAIIEAFQSQLKLYGDNTQLGPGRGAEALETAEAAGVKQEDVLGYANTIESMNKVKAVSRDTALSIASDNLIAANSFKELQDNWESLREGLSADKSSVKYVDSLKTIREATKKMLGTNKELSEEFLTNADNLKLFDRVLKNEEGAFEEFRRKAIEDIVVQFQLDDTTEENVIEALQGLQDYAIDNNLEIGAVLNDNEYLDSLNKMLNAGQITVDQMNEILSGIGWEPEITYAEMPLSSASNFVTSQDQEIFIPHQNPDGTVSYEKTTVRAANAGNLNGDQMVRVPIIGDQVKKAKASGYNIGMTASWKGTGSKAGITQKPSSSGGKGGGGGSSDKAKNWKNPYDELYNLTEQINENSRQRNLLEAEYDLMLNDRTKANDVLLKNSYEQLKNLEKELALQKQLQAGRKSQLDDILNETYEDSEGNRKTFGELGVGKYAYYDEESRTIVIDWEGLEALAAKAGSEEEGKAVEEYIKKLEDLVGQFEEVDSKVLEIEKAVQDIERRGMDEYVAKLVELKEAFIQARQDEIDELQVVSDTIEESTSRVIDGIREQVEAERQARENEKAEEDIADKEMRLAYLQRDTSGANDLEILKLNEELADARQDYTDSLIDQGIEKMQEQAEKAQQQRQKQIDLMTAQLAWDQKSGKFNDAAETILNNALKGGNSTLGKINTDIREIEGWFVEGEDGAPKFVSKTGEVFDAALDGKGSIKILDEEGNSYDFSALDTTKDTTETVKDILMGDQATEFTDAEKWKWEDDYHKQMKEAAIGLENYTKKQSKNNNDSDKNKDKNKDKDKDKNNTPSGGRTGTGGTGSGTSENGSGSSESGGEESQQKTIIHHKGDLKTAAEYKTKTLTLSEQLDDWAAKNPSFRTGIGDWKKYNSMSDPVSQRKASDLMAGFTKAGFKYDRSKTKKVLVKAATYYTSDVYGYKTGGLVDFTGPAWLDGTKTKPEIVLNQADSQNLIILKDILSQLLHNPIQSGSQGAGGDNYYEINIDAEIANDYDVDRLASRIKQQIYSDGMYRNVNTLNWQR